ncbi:hypothetical protein ScPMuIL_009832 [Solemya velum]
MPEHIKVVACCRPFTPDEESKGLKNIIKISGDKLIVEAASKEQSFGFDGVHGHNETNARIYQDQCEQLLKRSFEGFNVSILAMGATGAGKTFLMTGSEKNPGIVPNLNRSLFQHMATKSNKEFFITVSYVEVLDEKMTDLLNPHSNPMKVRQHPHKGIFVEGLSEIVVKNVEDLKNMYEQGTRARQMGATDVSGHRTRANSIFTITLEQKEMKTSRVGLKSLIRLVDLAGTESGGSADPSILAGVQGVPNILSILGGQGKGRAVPYRDSKVTQILQDTLGGNAATLVFAVVSPTDKSYQETLTTLQYAQYAKSVKNSPKMNMVSDMRKM